MRSTLARGALVCGGLAQGCLGMPNAVAPEMGGSVGVPHDGVLTGGVSLAQEGDGYRRFRDDDTRWGNPRLVHAIERAARAVADARPDGGPLVVGDLSARDGGFIAGHRSHRTGRDADLILYAMTPSGASIQSPGFVHYASDGMAAVDNTGFVRFDVERNWLLVKALMSDDEALVQYLFIARWLEALIIEHALARGEDDEIVWRAAEVLRQPGDSSPHDDHFHVRIACTPDEQVAGCTGGGPQRPWLPVAEPRAMSDDAILAALFDGGGEPDAE